MKQLNVTCPECGAMMRPRWSKGLQRWFFGCVRYPQCQATHGMHQKTGEPLGVPADGPTRKARVLAHQAFDRLWKGKGRGGRGALKRIRAYWALAEHLGITNEECHIGRFDAAQCQRVIDWANDQDPKRFLRN